MKPNIFISIPRTGTHSIRDSLGIPTKYNHHPAIVVKNKVFKNKPEEWKNSVKFAFVRNPFDRLVSWYFYHRNNQKIAIYKISFKKWIMNGCPNHWTKKTGNATLEPLSLWHYLLDENDNILVDFIGKCETMNKDFNRLTKLLGCPSKKLKKLNQSCHKKYPNYYDKESRKKVEKLFAKDLELFKYKY